MCFLQITKLVGALKDVGFQRPTFAERNSDAERAERKAMQDRGLLWRQLGCSHARGSGQCALQRFPECPELGGCHHVAVMERLLVTMGRASGAARGAASLPLPDFGRSGARSCHAGAGAGRKLCPIECQARTKNGIYHALKGENLEVGFKSTPQLRIPKEVGLLTAQILRMVGIIMSPQI